WDESCRLSGLTARRQAPCARSQAVTPSKCSLLLVDDEPYILPTLQALLTNDFDVATAASAEAAQEIVAARPIDIVLTDQKMPNRTGIELLEWVKANSPRTIRLLMTGYAELDDAVEAINRGHVYHYLLKPWRIEELMQVLRNAAEKFQLERSREHLLDELKRLNQELEDRVKQRTRELEMLAMTDPLTGLLNRRAIDNVAANELKRQARYPGSPLAIGLIDADNFREINRCYLHTGGDEVLRGLAKILITSLRSVDFVGRVGGEEFLVVAPETHFQGAGVLAERIRATVESSPIWFREQAIPVTVSLGFAVTETGIGGDYDQMKHVAAAALNEAKATGRNRFVIRSFRKPSDAA
ncbi:MAG TPA: diguanylate cyclase, partial [Gemmataceae bacterium]|nr:diguanylate cyclase [Gemmataceae bacterium]